MAYHSEAVHVGFGTDRGTVAAASDWDMPMEIKRVRPAREDSYEFAFRKTGTGRCLADWRPRRNSALADALREPTLERAIGVVYLPETGFASHYFKAVLGRAVRSLCLVRGDDGDHAIACAQRCGHARNISLRPVTAYLMRVLRPTLPWATALSIPPCGFVSFSVSPSIVVLPCNSWRSSAVVPLIVVPFEPPIIGLCFRSASAVFRDLRCLGTASSLYAFMGTKLAAVPVVPEKNNSIKGQRENQDQQHLLNLPLPTA